MTRFSVCVGIMLLLGSGGCQRINHMERQAQAEERLAHAANLPSGAASGDQTSSLHSTDSKAADAPAHEDPPAHASQKKSLIQADSKPSAATTAETTTAETTTAETTTAETNSEALGETESNEPREPLDGTSRNLGLGDVTKPAAVPNPTHQPIASIRTDQAGLDERKARTGGSDSDHVPAREAKSLANDPMANDDRGKDSSDNRGKTAAEHEQASNEHSTQAPSDLSSQNNSTIRDQPNSIAKPDSRSPNEIESAGRPQPDESGVRSSHSPAEARPKNVDNDAYFGVRLDSRSKAAKIGYVRKQGPSAKAGLMVGDILIAIDSKLIATTEDLASVIQSQEVGNIVHVLLARDGEYLSIPVRLGSRTNPNDE